MVLFAAVAFSQVSTAQQLLGGARQPARAVGPTLDTKSFGETEGAHAGKTHRLALEVRLSEGWHVNAHEPLEEYLIPTDLTFEDIEGVKVTSVVYPEGDLLEFDFSDVPMLVYEEKFPVGVVIEIDGDVAPGEYVLKGNLRWQACNDKNCWRPLTASVEFPLLVVPDDQSLTGTEGAIFKTINFDEGTAPVEQATPVIAESSSKAGEGNWRDLADRFTIIGSASGYLKTADFIDFVDRSESGQGLGGMFEGMGLAVVIFWTLLGGLALNLTPCVLPMIPINIAIIGAGAQAGSRARGFALGGTYGAGIALVYGLLGLIVVVTAGSFGALNQAAWFNFSIAGVFVLLGLAMFDIITIDFSSLQNRFGGFKKGRGTFLLALTMGSIAALLAGACVAPAVIAVILFSQDLYAGHYYVAGLSLPFVLGLGMALPWPFAGAGLSFLPKPGKWMTYVKYVFGVFILGFALYYGHLGYTLLPADSDEVIASMGDLEEGDWRHSLTQALTQAEAEDKPVLIDFWATWCKNCLVMNETTFQDQSVSDRLEGYVKVKFQAEDYGDPLTREVMDYFEVLGLPTYIVMEPGASST